MAAATLAHRYIFGLKGDVNNNIAYIDEGLVVYPAGHNVIVYNTENKTQRFIQGSDNSDGITAMCISPSCRYVAVAERAPERGSVTIFDLHYLKKRKVLSTTESASREFVSVAFSPDNRMLLTQGGAPDWTLVLWAWERPKLLASIKVSNAQGAPIYNVSFNPVDQTSIAVCGNGIFRFYRIQDNQFKSVPNSLQKRDPQNYLCHSWLPDDRLVAGTDTGDILLFESGEFRCVLPSSPADGNSIDSIIAYSKGFVCGGDEGILNIYERSDDRDLFKRTKMFSVEGQLAKILNLSISPSEDNLACTLSNNQMYTLGLSNTDILKPEEMNFELLSTSFHGPGTAPGSLITGLDTCVRKPLLVTCGMDRSVRVWNYLENTTDLVKFFSEEAYSVSIHPSGLHILVGFSDKLRLMNLLMDDIRPYKELQIKACREVKFSNGGHYFAAVNSNTIQVYDTYSCENILNLRGHNNKVRSIWWSRDDSMIISAGIDGAVYQYQLRDDGTRSGDFVQKGCIHSCVVAVPDGSLAYTAGSDRKLKEIKFPESTISKEFEVEQTISQIALSHQGNLMFFAGTGELDRPGYIRSYRNELNGEFAEYACHAGPVTRLRISFDDQFLFSAGDDGTLAIFEIREREGRARTREMLLPWAEEILVTKTDLEEKNALMNELKAKVEELTLNNEYQLRLKDMNFSEKMKEMTEKYTQELEQDKNKYELLREEKNDMEMEYEEKIKIMQESHEKSTQDLQAEHNNRLMEEMKRFESLENEHKLQMQRWEQQNAMLIESHERYIAELTEEYQSKLDEMQAIQNQMQEEKDDLIREFEETRRQIEEDADREIEELKEAYEEKLRVEKEQTLRLKGENGITHKKLTALQRDKQEQNDEIKAAQEREKQLYEEIETLRKDIRGHKKEIRERDETIGDKEKRIYDLKKKNQELEKFKFVLDYKIKELKRQIEPRENEISDMKDQIKEMDAELEQYHKSNAALDLMIAELRLKLDGMQREILKQRKQLQDSQGLVRRFRGDLHDAVQHIQEPKVLKEDVIDLYKRYVQEQIQPQEVDVDIQREYNRQREYLERSVETLKRKLAKDMEMHRNDNRRIMQENVALIKEINELRREMRHIKTTQYEKDVLGLTGRGSTSARSRHSTRPHTGRSSNADKEIEMQRQQIAQLREHIARLEEALMTNRPISREKLPPMDGNYEGHAREIPVDT